MTDQVFAGDEVAVEILPSGGVGLSFGTRPADILSTIANLSSDEVFTPPELANRMLNNVEAAWAANNVGEIIWSRPDIRFLDPATKSGVFLREIARRLIEHQGNPPENSNERKALVDRILTTQVYGIGMTTLTSLLARRSVYCTKTATGKHSVAPSFNRDWGNIWFEPTKHTWVGRKTERRVDPLNPGEKITVELEGTGRCRWCGASEESLNRDDAAEGHAYTLIHTDDPHGLVNKLFGDAMQFDVIVGNPPYQLDVVGYGTSAAPIYQKFVEQAKKLNPRLLSLVIPSRWFTGGKGLDEFRGTMLNDRRLRSIDDFLTASDVFPGVGLKGGVCYFLWDRDNEGDCRVTTRFKDWEDSTATRPLLEPGADVFIRFNEGVSILKKVMEADAGNADSIALPRHASFEGLVSPRKPFGLTTSFQGHKSRNAGDVKVYQNGGVGYLPRKDVTSGTELVDTWKIFVSYAAPGTGNKDTYPHRVISTPFVAGPGTISTETYLCIGPFDSEAEAESALSYLTCRLTRLLIQLRKASQHVTSRVYSFVPTQTWDRTWTDAELYTKYGLSENEIAFIEKIVRPMEID